MTGTYDLYEGKKKVSDTDSNIWKETQDDYLMFQKNILERIEKLEEK